MPLSRARRSSRFLIERLRIQASELSQLKNPGDHHGPHLWLALIDGLLDTAESYLTQSNQPGIASSDAIALVRDATEISGLAYNCIYFMRGSGIEDLPYPLVTPLQDWFNQLHVKNTTFFRAELIANYELQPLQEKIFKGIRNQSPKLQAVISEIEWPLLRVTVPSKTFSIIPHFAIVAHEIGHALYGDIIWDTSGFSVEETALISRIEKRLGASLNPNTADKLLEASSNWLQELASDAFAFFLTGPAIFFSLSEFLPAHGGYGLGFTHPANDLRLSILFEKLKQGGSGSFSSIFTKHTGQTITEDFNSPLVMATPGKDQIASDMETRYHDKETAAVLAELHESVQKVESIVYQHVSDFMVKTAPDAIYTPAKFDTDLSEHLASMLAAIPPMESGTPLKSKKPTNFASIINIGWVVSLTKLDELRVKVEGEDDFGAEKLERLHSLLLKAVELSEVRKLWTNVT